MEPPNQYLILGILSVGCLLRATISLHSYSGELKPPMYGDFEAQRHWQEITINLPIKDWYENTTNNDLQYWGLDYPPLTAYHSYLCGRIAKYMNETFVSLHSSRGITDSNHKNFMRNTVLFIDFLIYIPALYLCCLAVYEKLLKQQNFNKNIKFVHLAVMLYYPGQILIDNGHFQYNNVSLGLAALAITSIFYDKELLGSFLFVLSLNYKQMELYHSLPFFFYLLGICFKTDNKKIKQNPLVRLIKIGLVVVATFAVIWMPWLKSLDSAIQVLHRIFPFARGVFEDKVSNVWCVINVFYKLKNISNDTMALTCFTLTISSIIPSSINLLMSPSKKSLLYALVNSSLAFFLFSFQVHEKTILLVSLPAMLLFPLDPIPCLWFLQISTFSMLPLFIKDNLIIGFLALSSFYILVVKLLSEIYLKNDKNQFGRYFDVFLLRNVFNIKTVGPKVKNSKKNPEISLVDKSMLYGFYLSFLGSIIIILCYFSVTPPERFPHLFPLIVSAYSCGHFLLFLIYFNEVVDESDGCGGKFSAVIVSPQFEGKSLLQKHRLVNSALSEELKTIHAFSQKTFTPQQWADK